MRFLYAPTAQLVDQPAPLSVLQLVLRYTIKDSNLQIITYWIIIAPTNQLQSKRNLLGFLRTLYENQEMLGPPLFPSQEHTFSKEMD